MVSNLDKIINTKVIIPVTKTVNSSFINLKEDDIASKIKELRISDIPDGSIAFTLDFNEEPAKEGGDGRAFKKLSPYLSPDNKDGINKSCDLVIVTPLVKANDKKLNVIVLDLKSDRVGSRGEIQIENSILFIKYLLSILEYHYKEQYNNITFFKRLVTTSPVKNAIGKKGRDQSITHKINARVLNEKSTINYCRLIV